MIPWSTPDLSNVTLVLKSLLDQAVQDSGLSVGNIAAVSCNSPETVRNSGSQCFLTLYLVHIGRDPFWRNTPRVGSRPQLNNAQPLSLNLSYLLTAYCEKDFQLEQRAMSIALQAIQSNPIMNQNTTPPPLDLVWPDLPDGEFVVSIEADTIDEMSRLWQAFTVPMRLSALIKVSVVFITPPVAVVTPAIPPQTVNLDVSPELVTTPPPVPAPVPAPPPTLVPGSGLQFPPVVPGTVLSEVTDTANALIGVGNVTLPNNENDVSLAIAGSGLDQTTAAEVFLSALGGGPVWKVTAWRVGTAQASELDLMLPVEYADPASGLPAPPAATPLPGLYKLSVGKGATPLSNSITIAIAPRVDGVTNPPLLSANSAGVYTVSGAGFLASDATTVVMGTAALANSTATTPGMGKFHVDPTGTSLVFKAPSGTAKGEYPVVIAVNGVAASVGWVAVVS